LTLPIFIEPLDSLLCALMARWLPAVAYMALIFYSSSQSNPAPLLTRNIWDKLLHGGGYAVLASLYLWALTGSRRRWRTIAIAAVVLTSVYAASDEVHQIFTPGRMPEVADWIADTIGGALAVACWSLLAKR
jgi:VanZ family protein